MAPREIKLEPYRKEIKQKYLDEGKTATEVLEWLKSEKKVTIG